MVSAVMSSYVNRIVWIEHHIPGITRDVIRIIACLIGKSEPRRTVRCVVALRARDKGNRQQTVENRLFNSEFIHFVSGRMLSFFISE